MRHRFSRAAAGLGFSVALGWGASARAQRVDTVQNKKGYGYVFRDVDALNSNGLSASAALIRVRPRAARSTLIRPRVSFVPELLKSVEHL